MQFGRKSEKTDDCRIWHEKAHRSAVFLRRNEHLRRTLELRRTHGHVGTHDVDEYCYIGLTYYTYYANFLAFYKKVIMV